MIFKDSNLKEDNNADVGASGINAKLDTIVGLP
jgi:hypothetical protein